MVKRTFTFILLFQLILNMSFVSSQNSYQKGWDSFSKNNRVDARKYFNDAVSDPTTGLDALLSLCLLDWNENKLDAAFDNFKKFYEKSPNPYPYLYSISSLPFLRESDDIMNPGKLSFFEKIQNDPKMNGTLKAMICERLGAHHEKTNNGKKATEYFGKIGALYNWQVLGTFDNTSASGFSKDWGVTGKAHETDMFKNKVGVDVHWYAAGQNKSNNWFYFDYYFYMSNAIMYAQTFVNSPSDQEVYLRAGTSGSLKIWVNDALVSSESEERNCDLDIYVSKVKLSKGNNRLVVQIGVSEIDRANFLIRLTDVTGNPVSGLTNTASYSDYTKASATPSIEKVSFFAEDFFAEKLKTDKTNPINYFLLAETYLHNDKSYEATKTLKAMEALSGKSTLTGYRLYEAYIRAQNQTDYDKEMEGIKTNDPDCFFSLETKFNEAIKSEKYSDAEDICKKVKTLYGEGTTTENWDVKLATVQKRFDDLIAMAKKLYKKYPERADLMQYNFQIEKNVSKNPKAAIEVIENYCKSYYNPEVIDLLSKTYLEIGNTDKGLGVLYKRIEKMPYATGYYDNLIVTLFNMQRYKEALAITEKQIALTPFLPGGYLNQGYIYKNAKQTEESKVSFKKAIYYGPTSYDARTQIRLLDNKKEVYDLFPKNNIKDLIKTAPTSKEYPEDNSVILLNDYQMVIYPENAKEYHYELAVKILNQAGIEFWKEYTIGYNSYSEKLIVDKTEVLKANGSVAKAETNDDNRVVFSNLEVNDVIHIEYRIQNLSTGKLAKDFFDHFQFQYSIPSLVSRYSLLVPADKKFTYKVANGDLKPEISDVENMKLYKWELDNQPAVKDEPYKSELLDIVPTLYYSSMPDWKYVSDWYKDLTTSKFNTDFVLKETISDLLKGKENLSQLEKARIFYYYILKNITYSSVSFLQGNYIPQKASRTITTRLGDCKDLSTLFVALCREAGINANLVLILTRDNGNHTLVLPEIGFNHCIAQLNIDNKRYLLELTDNNLPFGAALRNDLSAEILPIPFADEPIGDKLIKMEMPGRLPNTSLRTHTINFNKNDMTINRKYIARGAMASGKRGEYKDKGADEQLKQLNEAVAKEFDVSTKVSNLTFSELDNLTDSVTVSYKVDVKNAMQDVVGMKIFRLPWSDTNSLDMVAAEERKFPLEYWTYQTEDNTTEKMYIDIPQGRKLAEVPQNLRYDCTAARYSLTFDTSVPGKLTVTRYFERKADQVELKDYTAFRDFMNKVSEADSKQYAFK